VRIFQVLEAAGNAAVSGSQTWHRNLCEHLVDMGHEVSLFSTKEGRQAMARDNAQARARFSQKLLDTFYREHTKKPIDLFFVYLVEGYG
jgi:hypothetical protein